MKKYSNRFSSIEQNPDGTWNAFNDVQGICVKDSVSYEEARDYMISTYQHYAGIEKQAGW